MIREICKDEFFLSQKSEPATADDLAIVQDLLDTLAAHKATDARGTGGNGGSKEGTRVTEYERKR